MNSVYLAGPIMGTTDAEMRGWRDELIQRLPKFEFIDPAKRDYRGRESDSVREIVEQDKANIDACRIVVAYCPRPSVGTSMEILYAHQGGLRVLAWVPPDSPVSPWLTYHSHRIYRYGFEVESALLRESMRS